MRGGGMVRITKLGCRGLYSYRDTLAVDVPDRVVVVGPNNSGKSNLFRLIRLFADTLSESSTLEDRQIAKGVSDPRLELRMELSEAETEKIVDFFSFYSKQSNSNMRFVEYENRAQLLTLLDEITVRILWKKTPRSGTMTSVEIEFVKINLKMYGVIGYVLDTTDRPAPRIVRMPYAEEYHTLEQLHISDRFAPGEAENEHVDTATPLHELLAKLSDQVGAKGKVGSNGDNYLSCVQGKAQG